MKFAKTTIMLLSLGLPAVGYAQETAGEYVFRAGDVVRLAVWPDSSYNGDFPIEDNGVVHLPFVGPLDVAGKTLQHLRSDLRTRFGRELQQPVVTITPLFRVSILGEIMRPGLYAIDPTHSLFDVIALAGGYKDSAKPGDVRIVRDGQIIRVDAQINARATAPESDLALRSGDRIIVSRRRALNTLSIFYILQSAVVIASLFRD